MSNPLCEWSEEEVVDFVLGRIRTDQKVRFAAHLPICATCSHIHREWVELLASQQAEQQPSPALWQRLKRSVWLTAWLRTHSRWLRPARLVPISAVAILLLVLFGVNGWKQPVPIEKNPAVQHELLHEQDMVMHPNTVLHEVIPVSNSGMKGYVWLNDISNELLLLAEGLDELEEQDYQVWLIRAETSANGGLLQWREGMAHLYFHGGELRGVNHIMVSIEPKGGSFMPTGPEAMFVQIK